MSRADHRLGESGIGVLAKVGPKTTMFRPALHTGARIVGRHSRGRVFGPAPDDASQLKPDRDQAPAPELVERNPASAQVTPNSTDTKLARVQPNQLWSASPVEPNPNLAQLNSRVRRDLEPGLTRPNFPGPNLKLVETNMAPSRTSRPETPGPTLPQVCHISTAFADKRWPRMVEFGPRDTLWRAPLDLERCAPPDLSEVKPPSCTRSAWPFKERGGVRLTRLDPSRSRSKIGPSRRGFRRDMVQPARRIRLR